MVDQPSLLADAPQSAPPPRRKATAPSPEQTAPESCGACLFGRDRAAVALRRCRRLPPIGNTAGNPPRPVWPVVLDDDWCGEFKRVDA